VRASSLGAAGFVVRVRVVEVWVVEVWVVGAWVVGAWVVGAWVVGVWKDSPLGSWSGDAGRTVPSALGPDRTGISPLGPSSSPAEVKAEAPAGARPASPRCGPAPVAPPGASSVGCSVTPVRPLGSSSAGTGPAFGKSHAGAGEPAGAEPAAGPKADPAAGPKADPAAGPKADPAAGPKADPAAGPNGDPAAGPRPRRDTSTRPEDSASPAANRTSAAARPAGHGSGSPQSGQIVMPSRGPAPPACACATSCAVRASTLSGFTYVVDAIRFPSPVGCPLAGTARQRRASSATRVSSSSPCRARLRADFAQSVDPRLINDISRHTPVRRV
jgi:hypothetical protein